VRGSALGCKYAGPVEIRVLGHVILDNMQERVLFLCKKVLKGMHVYVPLSFLSGVACCVHFGSSAEERLMFSGSYSDAAYPCMFPNTVWIWTPLQ